MSTQLVSDWQEWKIARERDLADPYGWLALVSLDWLTEVPRAYPGLPGLWWQDEQAAHLDPQGAEARHEGEPVTGPRRFELVNSGAGTRVLAGGLEIEIARRGGYLIRVHDPEAQVLRDFRGVPAYEPRPEWVLTGRFEAFDQPRPTTVGAVVEGLSHVYTAPGVVRFEHEGAEHVLTAFNGKDGGLSILFTDATSGVTTYAANRSLAVPAPAEDGTVVLDFTRAVNLPCAFTDFATCPLPPEGNRLPFAVEAGEKLPYERQR
ncbi:DUF1684 domain-containing protein [Kutzneria viridogrisea]|uniref:DUF1684 domain-containing protein n=2 Tax=Kutzneria TaxID=43356 RepID=W5WMD7_9PSEU|nr:DUF1684 domain-containing protein [Kutzneria albida]AHH99339.1 hypothetical protein KALB_5979 [Kutzneria albida DSM 43870]MBA8923106.1 hypothetical protein [Kutzneria viridogrisea]